MAKYYYKRGNHHDDSSNCVMWWILQYAHWRLGLGSANYLLYGPLTPKIAVENIASDTKTASHPSENFHLLQHGTYMTPHDSQPGLQMVYIQPNLDLTVDGAIAVNQYMRPDKKGTIS